MRKKGKLIFGVGVNDADYAVLPTINNQRVFCPFYRAWKDMIRRCYDAKYQARWPTYIGCSVTTEWHVFSRFKLWMQQQNWQGNVLDKDLLLAGNKIYSPETCVFVDSITNTFTLDSRSSRGKWLIGVSLVKSNGKFLAQCRNPFTKKGERLGLFSCENLAHQAWRRRKHDLSMQLSAVQSDDRVRAALMVMYL